MAWLHGRQGKGCVIVFVSGNQNLSTVDYPANLDAVIAVGAVSLQGERKSPTSSDTETSWGSNYGNQLDIVAPGVLIPTIDRSNNAGYNPSIPIHTNFGGNLLTSDYVNTNYTVWFCGTSAAAPHVSGVAALILSRNISLTVNDVRHRLLTYTTQLPGTYQVGHRLVNAYEAVAHTPLPPTFYITDDTFSNYSGQATVYFNRDDYSSTYFSYYMAAIPGNYSSYRWSGSFDGNYTNWYFLDGRNASSDWAEIELPPGSTGGTLHVTCKIYDGSTLLAEPTFDLHLVAN